MRTLFLLALAACLSVAGAAAPKGAKAPTPPPASSRLTGKNLVESAIGIYLTKRGQKYFAENLSDLLFRQGFSIEDGGFEGWSYQAKEPLVLDRLPVKFGPFQGTLGQVRDILKKWVIGPKILNDPLLSAELKEIHYELEFDRFGIHVDTERSAQRNDGKSVVLTFELDAKKGRVLAETLRAEDLANPFLKVFGANRLWLGFDKASSAAEFSARELGAKPQPLKVTVPILFEVDEQKSLHYRVLDLQSNFSQVEFDAGFDRPLLLPKASLIVNRKEMPVNQTKIEDLLLKHKGRMLKALQLYLEEYAEENVPRIVNDLIQKNTPEGLWETNQMDPPGAPVPGPGEAPPEKFTWSMRPEAIRVLPEYLNVALGVSINDPSRSRQSPYFGRREGAAWPALNLIQPSEYDIALSLNLDLINRLLQLSFERGYFDDIVLDSGASLKIVNVPHFVVDPKLASDRAKLHIRAAQKVKGFQKVAVRSPLEFEADIEVKLVRTEEGALAVELARIDEHSITVDDRYIKMGLFRSAVLGSVHRKVRAANQSLAAKPKRLVDQLPIPQELAGVPIRIKAFQSDRNGHLVIYVEYAL